MTPLEWSFNEAAELNLLPEGRLTSSDSSQGMFDRIRLSSSIPFRLLQPERSRVNSFRDFNLCSLSIASSRGCVRVVQKARLRMNFSRGMRVLNSEQTPNWATSTHASKRSSRCLSAERSCSRDVKSVMPLLWLSSRVTDSRLVFLTSPMLRALKSSTSQCTIEIVNSFKPLMLDKKVCKRILQGA